MARRPLARAVASMPVLLALASGLLAAAADRWLALSLYPGVQLFFGSVPVLMIALSGGWLAALVASFIAGACGFLMWGHPMAWVGFALEAVAVSLLAKRANPALVVLGFWALVGLPAYAMVGLTHAEGADVGIVALALKTPFQEVFAALLAQNLLLLPTIRNFGSRLAPRLQLPVVSLQRFQLSFIALLLIATAGTVMIVQARAIERDERAAIGRLDQATAALAAAELSSSLEGYGTALAVAGGLWPGLSPTQRTARARAALESGHFELFAWLNKGLQVQGGWRAGRPGAPARPATADDMKTSVMEPIATSGDQRGMLMVTPVNHGRAAELLVLYPLANGTGYLVGGVSLQSLASHMAGHFAGREMVLELRDAAGKELAEVAEESQPGQLLNKWNGVRPPDLRASVAVPHTSWRLVALTPGWVLQQRVNGTLWRAVPPLLLLLLVLGAMGTGTIVLLRQELGQITKSTVQLGRLAIEEAGAEPHFEQSVLVEVERLNMVYRRVAASLRHAFQSLRKRDAELSLANGQLSTLVDTLRGMDKNRAEVMNAISHDIKIPLTAVVGYTELLEDETAGPLTPDQRDYVRNIGENSQKVIRLLEDLLDFARMEVGRFSLDPQDVEVGPALERTLRNLQPLLDAQGLKGSLAVAPDLPPATADPRRLDQILNNLLSNAIKFTAPGGSVVLQANHSSDHDEILVQVVDTGRGIAPEHMAHLFERFYRVPGSNDAPGTGLGLAISRKLVEAMGGRMGVLSEVGKGSTFWFTLPLSLLPDVLTPKNIALEPLRPS
jgi:signal transduction histidine kinase